MPTHDPTEIEDEREDRAANNATIGNNLLDSPGLGAVGSPPDGHKGLECLPPWEANPYRLVSLWDIMRLIPAGDPHVVGATLWCCAHWNSSSNEKEAKRLHELCSNALDRAYDLAKSLDLLQTRARIEIIRGIHPAVPSAGFPGEEYKRQVFEIYQSMSADVSNIEYLHVAPNRRKYYCDADIPSHVPELIFDRFPSTRYDIIESSNCIALSRPTASVFHSMRAIETLLRALASRLRVSSNIVEFSSGQTIINKITAEIKSQKNTLLSGRMGKRNATNRAAQNKIEQLSDVCVQVELCKDAWRNSVAHARRVYTEQEAIRIFDIVVYAIEKASAFLREKKQH